MIVVAHGLWFGAWAMRPLARRLAPHSPAGGEAVHRLDYRSTRASLDEHAQNLLQKVEQWTQGRPTEPLHMVGHSLGGLVILRALGLQPELPAGRVVLLGSPINGSEVARRVSALPGGRRLFGRISASLEQGHSALPPGREVGMIAGSKAFGLGWLVGAGRRPGDGTVSLAETRSSQLTDHLIMPVTHTGLAYSRSVAAQARFFIQKGCFSRPDCSPSAVANGVK